MLSTEARNILIDSQWLIVNPEHWTQKSKARDKDGQVTGESSPAAYSRCSIGSLQHARDKAGASMKQYHDAMFHLANVINPESLDYPYEVISEFNDTHTHAEVMNAYDKAIAEDN